MRMKKRVAIAEAELRFCKKLIKDQREEIETLRREVLLLRAEIFDKRWAAVQRSK